MRYYAIPQNKDSLIAMVGVPPDLADKELVTQWEIDNIVPVEIPWDGGIRIAWDLSRKLRARFIRVHKFIAPVVQDLLNELYSTGLYMLIEDLGGGYTARCMRGSKVFSMHYYGLAIDINILTNPFRKLPRMPYFLVKLFKKYGFFWGGDWKNLDGMHFEYYKGSREIVDIPDTSMSAKLEYAKETCIFYTEDEEFKYTEAVLEVIDGTLDDKLTDGMYKVSIAKIV